MTVNQYSKYIKQYQTNNINTATPEKLMIMMFDGAIQFLQKAKTAIQEKNLRERAATIEQARKIIRELMRTIDLENGNDVSKRLFLLYNRMAMKLIRANVTREEALVDEVIADLMNIRWGFQKAIDINNGILTVEEAMKQQSEREAELNSQKDSESGTAESANSINTGVNAQNNSGYGGQSNAGYGGQSGQSAGLNPALNNSGYGGQNNTAASHSDFEV